MSRLRRGANLWLSLRQPMQVSLSVILQTPTEADEFHQTDVLSSNRFVSYVQMASTKLEWETETRSLWITLQSTCTRFQLLSRILHMNLTTSSRRSMLNLSSLPSKPRYAFLFVLNSVHRHLYVIVAQPSARFMSYRVDSNFINFIRSIILCACMLFHLHPANFYFSRSPTQRLVMHGST